MKNTQNSPLRNRPSLDESGLLNDVGQLREVVRYLSEYLLVAIKNPQQMRGLSPTAQLLVDMALHSVTCTDCADEREKQEVKIEEDFIVALHIIFLSFVEVEDESNRLSEQESALSNAERALLEAIGRSLDGGRPLFN